MLYLPDSTLLVGYGRGQQGATRWFQTMLNSLEVVGYCAITVSEVFSGARPPERAGWREFFSSLQHWPISTEDGAQAGIYRYDFARAGIQLQTTDSLIAAVAKRVGATIVTDNVKDFPMTDVRVIRPD